MIRPVILCGGAGTRLWPLSREAFPKQFLSLFGEKSLLQQTAERLTGEQFVSAIVVTGEDQRPLIEAQLHGAGAAVEAILLEPHARNTAAAAMFAASWLSSTGRDELLLLLPSDHVIGDRDAFFRAIEIGVPHAMAGAIVTFGAEPTAPNTQYGYIEARRIEQSTDDAYPIARFHEKPSAEKAADYVAAGRFFWNCGIFLAKASTIIEEMRRFLPQSAETITAAVERGTSEGLLFRPSADSFSQAENISIDHAIMEKTSRGVVVPVRMQWSDVGAWDAVWKLGEKDADGNMTHGKVMALDSHNSLLRSDGPAMIAAIGLEGIAVIAVDDAILVAPIDRAAEVKELLSKMKDSRHPDATAGGGNRH